ncbi:MAG: hypothetical protein KBI14_19745 [Kofleriaceae bacterium]|nr:hypothetical protein [Kofleriaceae bacterium]
MKPLALYMTLEGAAYRDALVRAAQMQNFTERPPDSLAISFSNVDYDPATWRNLLEAANTRSRAYWDDGRQLGVTPASEMVAIMLPGRLRTPADAWHLLEGIPFEICCIGAAFFDEWLAADYKRWGFGRSHIDNGWGCAFRGRGHDRLVSRRWLDFGPWRVIRRPNDTTFIQFHDLALTDPAEAYAQAAPGLERMGNSPIGGHIGFHKERLIASAGKGLYSPSQRLLEVVVGPGNEVRQGDMLCNCALRLHHKETQPATGRIERIAYVFVDEGDARAHLHELWLRELECWVADDRGKRRLDLDYHPVPSPPAWVRDLEAREAT